MAPLSATSSGCQDVDDVDKELKGQDEKKWWWWACRKKGNVKESPPPLAPRSLHTSTCLLIVTALVDGLLRGTKMGDANAVRYYRAFVSQQAWRISRACRYVWRDVLAFMALVIAVIVWAACGEKNSFVANLVRLIIAAIFPAFILIINCKIYKKYARVDNEVTEATGVFNSKDLEDVKRVGAALATLLVPSAELPAALAVLPATLAQLTQAVGVQLASSLAQADLGRQLSAAGPHQDLSKYIAQLPAGTAARMASAALAAIDPDLSWWIAPARRPLPSLSNVSHGGGGGDGEPLPRDLSHQPLGDAQLAHLVRAALLSVGDSEGSPSAAGEGGAAAQDGRGGQGPVGLVNGGGTCYLNSVLQQLYHNLRFRDLVLAAPPVEAAAQASSVFYQVQVTLAALASGPRGPFRPTGLWNALQQEDGSLLDLTRHDDPHLFLTRLLAAVDAHTYNSGQASFVQQVLGGTLLVQHVPLKNLHYGTETVAAFNVVNLDVAGHCCLGDSLLYYIAAQAMEGANAWKCDRLGMRVAAVRRVSFQRLPELIPFHLKRFEYSEDGTCRKVNSRFAFSLRLNMRPYTHKKRDLLASLAVQVLDPATSGAVVRAQLWAETWSTSSPGAPGSADGVHLPLPGSVSPPATSYSSGDSAGALRSHSAPPLSGGPFASLSGGGTGQRHTRAASVPSDTSDSTAWPGAVPAAVLEPAPHGGGAAGQPSTSVKSHPLQSSAAASSRRSTGSGRGSSAPNNLAGCASDVLLSQDGSPSRAVSGAQASQLGGDEYELCGVLMHDGSVNSGHCWSLVKERARVGVDGQVVPARWWKVDDTRVRPWDPANMERDCFGGAPCQDVGSAGGGTGGTAVSSSTASRVERSHSAYLLFYDRC